MLAPSNAILNMTFMDLDVDNDNDDDKHNSNDNDSDDGHINCNILSYSMCNLIQIRNCIEFWLNTRSTMPTQFHVWILPLEPELDLNSIKYACCLHVAGPEPDVILSLH